jgi:hypothetical protein
LFDSISSTQLFETVHNAAPDAVALHREVHSALTVIARAWPHSLDSNTHHHNDNDDDDNDTVAALHAAAQRLAFRIDNRLKLRAELSRRFDVALVPADVVRRVMLPLQLDVGPPLDDDLCDALDAFVARRAESKSLLPNAAATDLDALCADLLAHSVARIRAAVLARLLALARADGSFEAELVQFRTECSCQMRFLRRHAAVSPAAAAVGAELRAAYCELVAAVYHYHFFTYRSDLAKLQTLVGIASPADTVASSQRRTSSGASTSDKRDIHEADVRRIMFSLSTPIELRRQAAGAAAGAADYLRSWLPGGGGGGASAATSTAPALTRADLLGSLSVVADASPSMRYVVYHQARTAGSLLRFEYAWWSFADLLFDAVLRELHLQLELFGALQDDVFADIWPFAETWLCDQMVDNSCDCVELLLVYACNVRNLAKLQLASLALPAHVAFFERVQARVVHRYTELMARHAASLAEFAPPAHVPLETNPHFVTQRYTDLLGSVFQVVARCDELLGAVAARAAAREATLDEAQRASFVASQAPSFVSHAVVTAPLVQVRAQFQRTLLRCADHFGGDVLRGTTFLINNLSYVVGALQSQRYAGVPLALQEAGAIESQLLEKLQVVTELLIAQHLPSMTRITERLGSGAGAEAVAHAFRGEWRGGQALASMHSHVLTLFVDYAIARLLLKQLGERIAAQHALLEARVGGALAISTLEVHNGVAKHLILTANNEI